MPQYPRPPPTTASPAQSAQTNPTRTNNSRDRDGGQHLRSQSTQGSGSSEDFVNTRQESSSDNNPTSQMQRLNQVIQNFHTKAALIILHSRVDLPPAYSSKSNEKRVNRWFNIELDETDEYNDHIRKWRKCDLASDRPPPLVIEVFLTTDSLAQGQRLVLLDEDEKRWDVTDALESRSDGKSKRQAASTNQVLLERWTIELGEPTESLSADLTSILPLVYKKSIVLFRSLFTYCNFLPAWKLSRKVGRSRANMSMKLGYRILDGARMKEVSRVDNLDIPLCESTTDVTTTYTFGETESPAGPFSVKVRYRENCDFRIDDSEELLSSRFLGADDGMFRPSLQNEVSQAPEAHKVGSLPTDNRQHLMERPELGHAYGSLSTFHQVGFSAGTSPISALRSARELGQPSASPEPARPLPNPVSSSASQRNSLRAAAAGRRSSFSFQPFKAPTLSASPLGASPLSSSPRTSSTRVPVLSSLTEERGLPLPNAPAVAARKSGSVASENPALSSTSGSPKPAPVRYSSSFSHRRARLSSGGTTSRPDEDQISSGRASATSLAAPPGSGLMTEAVGGGGASSGSMQEDDENISDFLKMLDRKKDLLTPGDAVASEASVRRTATALNRFHRMRDSNAALGDSMSSSLMVQRPSSTSNRSSTGQYPIVAPVTTSSSTSPGKPVSPHTPHTPFAPSRLSAAYSHEDVPLASDDGSHSQEGTIASEETAQARSGTNERGIDIPSSPRLFLPGYRRSSSAQRQPLAADEDIADLYGMRSASMGAQDRRTTSHQRNISENEEASVPDGNRLQPDVSPHHFSRGQRQAELMSTTNDGAASDSGSGRSSAHANRSRLLRGGATRGGGLNTTPPQGSASSFGGTGGSIERGGDSGGSVSGSWGRAGRLRSGSRPESKFVDDDEFLPFAMEKSDFTTAVPRKEHGN